MSSSKIKQVSTSILAGHRAGPDKQNIMPNTMNGGNQSSSSLAQHGSNALHQMPPHHHHNQIHSTHNHLSQMQHHKLMNMSNNAGGSTDSYQNHYSRMGPFFQHPGSGTTAASTGPQPHDSSIEGGQRLQSQQHHRSFGLELSNVAGSTSGQPPNKPTSSQGTRVKGNSTRLHLQGSLQSGHNSHGISGNLYMKSSRNRSRESLGPSGSASHNTSLNSGVHMFLNRGPGTRKHIHINNGNNGMATSGIMSTKNSNSNHNASSHNLMESTRGSTAALHHHHPIHHQGIHRGSNIQTSSQTSNGVRAHSANSFHKKQRAGSTSIGSGTVTNANAQQQQVSNNNFLPQPPAHSVIMNNNNSTQQNNNSSSIIPPPPCIGGPRRPSLRKVESLTARPHINLISTISNSSASMQNSSSRPGSIERGIATTSSTTTRASQNCIGSISQRSSSAQSNQQQYQRVLGSSGSSTSNSAVKIQRKRLDDFYLNLERDMQNQMLPCDFIDRKNPQLCSQYANEITKYIKEIESRFLPKHGYMRKQNDINQRMRAILVDWLVDVHLKFKLLPQTLYLTVNMIDRFLDKTIISRRKLQLVGISAMLISSKYEEIYPPEIKDFTYITDRAYTKQDVLEMESQILAVLEFNVTVPSSYRFLERFARLYNLQIANTVNVQQQQQSQQSNGSNTGVRTFMLARYLTELALIDYSLLKYPPRQVAASAIYIALRLMKFNPPWNQNLVNASNLTEQQLKPCAKELMSLLDQPDKSNLKAVKKKFSQKKFMEVSKLKLDISGTSSSTTASEDRKSNNRNNGSGSGRRTASPIKTKVSKEEFTFLPNSTNSINIPQYFLPLQTRNQGNYLISLGRLCEWMANSQLEQKNVNIFNGFSANGLLICSQTNSLQGVFTKDSGIDKANNKTDNYDEGILIKPRQTIFAQGCRGSLSDQAISHYSLRNENSIQQYGIGLKQVWRIDTQKNTHFQQGLVKHTVGWPLGNSTYGGSFIYHMNQNQVHIGLVVGLDYKNPYLNPYQEFQRLKLHPKIQKYLEHGECIQYGARCLNQGGFYAIPQKLSFPGGMLAGCSAGFLNVPKIKGAHNAMKTGMLAGQAAFRAFQEQKQDHSIIDIEKYTDMVKESWVWEELKRTRNFKGAFSRGLYVGLAHGLVTTRVTKGKEQWKLKPEKKNTEITGKKEDYQEISYPPHDGVYSFELLSNLQRSGTNHNHDQPSHLVIKDGMEQKPIQSYREFAGPQQRFCPAKVYEFIQSDSNEEKKLQINAQNCLHCKCCSIKMIDEYIDWNVPQSGGGPAYSGM